MTRHLGLDLGGTNIKLALVDFRDGEYEVVATDRMPTGAAGGPPSVVANLIDAVSRAEAADSFASFGLGVPGLFDAEAGTVEMFPNLPGDWTGFPLRERLASPSGMSVWMVNDARAFTMAEGLLGAGKGHSIVACVTLGTGVGGGIIVDGRLHRGAFGAAGEWGHQTIEPEGPICGCGNQGCLEALTRADVLCQLAKKEDVVEVFEAASAGDDACIDAIERVTRYLGIGLANLVTIVGPSRIVVGGGIAEAGPAILKPIEDAMKDRLTLVPTDRLDLVPAQFGVFSGAVGAALAGKLRQ